MNQNVDELLPFRESMKVLNNALNKSAKTGAFTIDESYMIKIAISNMEKLIEICDTSRKQQTEVKQEISTTEV